MSHDVIGGVDAGGSHTRAAVADVTARELARATGPSHPMRPGHAAQTAASIVAVVRDAAAAAGAALPLRAMAVGAAGTGRVAEQRDLTAALKASGVARRIEVVGDGSIALNAAVGDGDGIVVHAGTGSVAYARAGGVDYRTGGLGWQLGDEGSAYALARAALGAAGRAADGRGPATHLTKALVDAVRLQSFDDLVGWAQGADRTSVAVLARDVCHAAQTGDAVASALVDDAARALEDHVTALLAHFPGSSKVPVSLGGGLLAAGSPVRERLVTLLHAMTRVTVRDEPVDPLRGALHLAAALGDA